MENQKNYQKICLTILNPLPDRQRQILLRRFGLGITSVKETLQKIGDDFGITRERVRQIERDAISRLRELKNSQELESVIVSLVNYFKNNGGLKREEAVLSDLGRGKLDSYIDFILHLSSDFHYTPEGDEFFSFWAIEKTTYNKVKEVAKEITKALRGGNEPVLEEDLLNTCSNFAPEFVLATVDVSKSLGKGPLGKFGLAVWPEIRPKGVKDVAFLALLDSGKPLHFRAIAQRANEVAGDYFNGKIVLPQTVHNELIRDERFVLVGRGIYGLKEWGYSQGTVKEIIASVLREASRPLNKEEILVKVKNQRVVKDNTVFLNLSDKNYFHRNQDGKYIVQES